MSIIKTNGLIITENNFADYDKMLTMLTPGLGKISCAAKGARKQQSLLLAGSQFLCFGEYVLYKGTNTYNINSCEAIEVFYNIRTDLDKLKYAVHITKILQDVTTENQNSYKILQLALNTLYMISETEKELDLILSIFKMRLLSILGFTPNVNNCVGCQKEEVNSFSFRNNSFKCAECAKQDKSCVQCNATTQNAIRYIIKSPPKKLFSFNIPQESVKELEIISKIYLNEKLEKEYKMDI